MAGDPVVRLEPLRDDHADALYDALADPSLYRHLDDDPPPSVAWMRRRVAALVQGAPDDGDEVWLNWVIVDSEDRIVGTTQATIRADGPTSVAYVLAGSAQGQGIGRAAVDRMLDLLVLQHGVPEVQAEIDPANGRSIRLVESLGFVAAGTIGADRRFVRRLDR